MEKKFWYVALFAIIAYISYDVGYYNGIEEVSGYFGPFYEAIGW